MKKEKTYWSKIPEWGGQSSYNFLDKFQFTPKSSSKIVRFIKWLFKIKDKPVDYVCMGFGISDGTSIFIENSRDDIKIASITLTKGKEKKSLKEIDEFLNVKRWKK